MCPLTITRLGTHIHIHTYTHAYTHIHANDYVLSPCKHIYTHVQANTHVRIRTQIFTISNTHARNKKTAFYIYLFMTQYF